MDDQTFSDAQLVHAARAGDALNMGVLLERHRAPLHALALGMLGHGPQAQDAVHDTFLIALLKLESLEDPNSVGAWLRRVTRNVCLESMRKTKGLLPLDVLPHRDTLRSPDLSLEEHVDQLALRDWVWTAVSSLPETLRVTAMLRYFGSRPSYEEIALVLAVPVGTVKSRLNQVKIKLAEALLATADLDHTPTRLFRARTTAYFAAATDQMNQGRGYGMFADAFSDSPELTLPDGSIVRGRRHLIESLEEDMNAGIRMHLSHVHASENITILEATFENPPDDPDHCPPGTTQVHIQRNGKTQRVRLYFAPRPGADNGRRLHEDAT